MQKNLIKLIVVQEALLKDRVLDIKLKCGMAIIGIGLQYKDETITILSSNTGKEIPISLSNITTIEVLNTSILELFASICKVNAKLSSNCQEKEFKILELETMNSNLIRMNKNIMNNLKNFDTFNNLDTRA